MKADDPLDDLLERTRRVYQPPEGSLTESPPAGFVEALRNKRFGHSASPAHARLRLWERVSYAGAAFALATVAFVHLGTEREDLALGNAADPWMALPLNSEFAE